MRFPYLQQINTQSNVVGTFKGLNQNIVGTDGEFAQLKNVSDRYYPAISSRVTRGTLGSQLANPNGIMAREHLFYIDGTKCYYNGTEISGLTVTNGDKQLVNMGAYIIIFPDKKRYNTLDGSYDSLEASVSGTSFTFSPYSTGSAFTKIEHDGIDAAFAINDAVEISGTDCTEYDFEGTHVITDSGEDYIVIAGTITEEYEPTTSITIARNCPDMDYVCELDNRIWGCKYGLTNNQTVSAETDITDGTVLVDKAVFLAGHAAAGTYVYTATLMLADPPLWWAGDPSGVISDLSTIGITYTGTATEGDTITIKVEREAVNEIYACELGNPKNWRWYENTAKCSYAASVGSDGAFTGCVSHMGYVIFFKENTIHMMYGNKPANFALNTKTLPGVRSGCSRSLCIVGQTLYYVGRDGVYSFDGATPTKISENIAETISEGVASQYEERYYLSCKLGSEQTILVYDAKYGLWDQEDDDKFYYASYYNGVLHYVDKNKYLTTIAGSREESVEWMMESCDIVASSLDEKYISMFKMNLMLNVGSEAKILLKFDDEPMWHQKGLVHSTKNKTYTFPIIPQRCNKFRYRIEGKGPFKLLGLSMDVEGGSELNGNIQLGFRR